MLVHTHKSIHTHTHTHTQTRARSTHETHDTQTHTHTNTRRTRVDKHLVTCTCKHTNKTTAHKKITTALLVYYRLSHICISQAPPIRGRNVCCRARHRPDATKSRAPHAALGASDPAIPLEEDICRDCTTLSGCKPQRRRILSWHSTMANQGGITLLRHSRLRDGQ